MSGYILAIDQGTTSSKAFVIDEAGEIVGQAGHAFTSDIPKPGWVEHDPVEIWETQKQACRDAIKDASIKAREIEAVGITNQRETTVVWDRETGRPVTNAIVWQCRRTSDLCEKLVAQGEEGVLSGKRQAFSSTPISRPPSSSGYSRTMPQVMEKAGKANSASAPSTPGSSSTSQKAKFTQPTFPTPRGPCFLTSTAGPGTERSSDWLEIPGEMLPGHGIEQLLRVDGF